jgi:hypothetical protein
MSALTPNLHISRDLLHHVGDGNFDQICLNWVRISLLGEGEDGLGHHLDSPPHIKGNTPCFFLLKYMTSALFLDVNCSCAADAAFRAEQLKVAVSGWLR